MRTVLRLGQQDGVAAAEAELRQMYHRFGSRGGLIGIDRHGKVFQWASTQKMAWAAVTATLTGPSVHTSGCENRASFKSLV